MHYCIRILTKEFPTDKVIENVLQPFYWDNIPEEEDRDKDFVFPAFTWDWWQVGGRYNGALKLRYDRNADNDKYRWMFYEKTPRAGRLFRSRLLEDILEMSKYGYNKEEDYFLSMGGRDDYLYVDGAYVDDLINFEEECDACFGFIDLDGKAYVRSYWNGNEFIDNEKFDDQVKEICKDRKGCYVVVVDVHD